MDTSMTLTVKRPCSIDNCVGCVDLGLQRMCYAAQQCQLARCIGTMVHQRRPLCAIGMNMQALIAQQMSLVEGAWLVISETMVAVLALSGGVSASSSVTWPDQAFYGYICAAKDVSATAISIIMSSINGVAQSVGETPVAQAGDGDRTNNAKAIFSMTMAATTGFLNQIALAPLYSLIALQKTYICNANSILAAVSSDKLSMTIGDPAIQDASSKATGKCMSQYFAENAQGDGSGTDNAKSLVDGVVETMTNTAMNIRLDSMIHPIDATLTWMSGVVSGLQDVVQTIDRNKCKLPDQSAKDSFKCACNDWAFQIAVTRQPDTWREQGFWCSTTMTMMNFDGSTKYVYNPYSLSELQAILAAVQPSGLTLLDEYLKCVADGGTCIPPSTNIFDRQQVTLIPVYQRCLANYQSRQWDMGAHVMFNTSLHRLIQAELPQPECFTIGEKNSECVSNCLLLAASQGASNAACLDLWLQKKNVNSLDFFEYERVTGSNLIHACQVFTGPAQIAGAVGKPYRVCLDNYADTGACHLPHIVWSGRSTNKVPVGVDHATVITDKAQKIAAARATYAAIKNDVKTMLDIMNTTWDATNLKVSIFSAEGDMLHQYFDCLMLGALDQVDIWPGPDVTKPVWSRSRTHAHGREFELPCSGDALKDRQGKRDSRSPFTCGSYARRSAIKYFLRNGVNSDADANRQLVRVAVLKLLEELRQAWVVDLDNYMCQCRDGSHSPDCCVLDASCDPSTKKCTCEDGSPASYACCNIECRDSTFLPASFQTEFTSIQGSRMMDGLFTDVWKFLNNTVWVKNTPWLMYDDGGATAYNWTKDNLQLPVDHGLFDTTKPVSAYDASELGYPFKTTIWEMCHGLLHQVHFTMPMREGRPTTLDDAYDPDGTSRTINMTYREDFVRRLVSDAYKHSPLYWHYHVRHKPSQSAMCKRTIPRFPNSVNQTYFAHGYTSMTIGGNDVDCYCGWWLNASHCKVPAPVCERLVLLVGSTDVQKMCAAGGVTDNNALIASVMPKLITLEGGWKEWPCPSMQISDHWGIMADQTAWLKGGRSLTGVNDYILKNGTSGLRVGSLDWMMGAHIKHINPSFRAESIQPLTCDLAPPAALVDNFVDDLFPAAQGVRQSAAMSACTRFSIEVARQSAYTEAKLMLAAADQAAVVATWRRRCEAKIRQVAFCHVYGIYDVPGQSEGCPFNIDQSIFLPDKYTVTPGCLVIFNKKVYDPCLCNSIWCSPYSGQPVDRLNLNTLANLNYPTPKCMLFHVRDMVVERSTGRVPWPPTSNTSIPRPLARSVFMNDILGTTTSNIANNKVHWSVAEGSDAFNYCDLVVDWWPDNWKHPVGYHVTLPCSGAAHRTFDASWAALRVGTQVSMMHVPNALRNRTMQTNQFGAAGACRTHNYGMPTKIMNTIRFCTQADNKPVDPTVPKTAGGSADWGGIYCTDSPFQVPWSKGPTSVGTFFDYMVDVLPFSSWDEKSGHAPLKTCANDADCCIGCKCLASKAGGVCAKIEAGRFECAQHQHCTGDMCANCANKLCAGDGLCVRGVIEMLNNATFTVAARVLSDNCADGSFKVDTWGMSKEDIVPDILNASGMCSYRSWYEHRLMVKGCAGAQCSISGSDAWLFSSSLSNPKGAFDAGVLAVLPHACDREYEHMANMHSCSPGNGQWLLRDPDGASVSDLKRGTRTQTYRPDKALPIVKHANLDNLGAGFLGVPKMYGELGYGTMAAGRDPITQPPFLQACSSFGLCGDQASATMWYVNGILENKRIVTLANGTSRNYNSDDMKSCGSMGFIDGVIASKCRIDAAVVPLFYAYCSKTTASVCTKYSGGLYLFASSDPVTTLRNMASELNTLFNTAKATSINTWEKYTAAVDQANVYWKSIAAQSWTTAYPGARINHVYSNSSRPMGLYFLMSYGAYEFPFAWWWRCGWLMNQDISSGDAKECTAWDGKSWNPSTPNDVYPTELPGKTKGYQGRREQISRLQWLAQAPGVYTSANVEKARLAAHKAYESVLGSWTIPDIPFACYTKATFRKDIQDDGYILNAADVTARVAKWGTTEFKGCKGFKECLNHESRSIKLMKNITGDFMAMLKGTTPCTAPAYSCLADLSPQVFSFAVDATSPEADLNTKLIPVDQNFMPLFAIKGGANMPTTDYSALDDGCNTVHCCAGTAGWPSACSSQSQRVQTCSCITTAPLPSELQSAGITAENPNTPPWIIFSSSNSEPTPGTSTSYLTSGDGWVAMDICGLSRKSTRCTLLDPPATECAPLSSAQAQTVQSQYCGSSKRFGDDPKDENCVYHRTPTGLDCLGGQSIANKYVFLPPKASKASGTVTSVANKPCWLLSCSLTLKAFDQKVVFNKDPYVIGLSVKVKSVIVRYQYETRTVEWDFWKAGGYYNKEVVKSNIQNNDVTIHMKRGTGSVEKVLEYRTEKCDFTSYCAMNNKNTRPSSAVYGTYVPILDVLTNANFNELTADEIRALAVNVVKNTEDEFSNNPDEAYQASIKDCTAVNPPNINLCKNGDSKINYARKCTDAETLEAMGKRWAEICRAQSTHIANDENSRDSYRKNEEECPGKLVTDINYAKDIAQAQCWIVEYNQTYPTQCTAAPITGGCAYSDAYETDMANAGLPPAGFCPCAGIGCAMSKGTDTYAAVTSTSIFHTLNTQPVKSNAKLPTTASHFGVSIGMHSNGEQIRCGDPDTCKSTQHAAQLYRNMYVCIDCVMAPPTYCSGDHMCSFARWNWEAAKNLPDYSAFADVFTNDNNTYARAFAAVTWATQALLNQSFPSPVGATPAWVDFLEPYHFAEFNPLPLKKQFNKNIEDLAGYCASTTKLPVFGECQNDIPRRTLRSFVQGSYKVPEGSLIPSKHKLMWFLDQGQMTHTNIPAWNEISTESFFTTLFDDKVCAEGNIANLICYRLDSTTLAMNPVLSGRFEPKEGCDISEDTGAIDSQCNANVCPDPTPPTEIDRYNTFQGTNYGATASQMRCKARHGATPTWRSMSPSTPVNLCTKKPPRPTRCTAKQGMLGHTTFNGAQAMSVYSRGAWPDASVPSGLLSRRNPLLQFELLKSDTLGNITLDLADIGGHYIRMALRPSGVLAVSALPLRSYSTLAQAADINSTDWMSAWKQYAAIETASMMDQYAMRTCMSWDCPLRRRAFWTGQHPTFRPFSPSPLRTMVLYGTVTHPTTKPAPIPNGILTKYRTRNGFCLCPEGDTCLPLTGPCSAADTIASLTDKVFRTADVLQTTCNSQIDWPWVGGTLRDQSILPNQVTSCGVLDRLPAFMYRYHDSQTILPSSGTTLDDGGDCHMGRPASYSASSSSCTLVEKGDTYMKLDCGGTNVTLPRPRSANVTSRTRCESCDPLPVFKTADGQPLSEAEVSYGKLWRWAPARKLAQDLRFRLCGNDTACPAMKSLSLAEFWPNYMAGGLTGSPPSDTLSRLFASTGTDPDDPAWALPWMLCTSNGSVPDCQGSATKAEWLTNRKTTCDRIKELPNSNQAVANLTVCNLDDNLDNLCRVIQNARYRLFEANCQLSGSCRTSAFFYQPATYSISNDQFVRQTVQYFYNFTVEGSCPAYDDELKAIINQNKRTAQDCSAQSLEVLQIAINVARQVIHMFVMVAYYATQISLQVVGLISTTNPAPIIRAIMADIVLLLAQFMKFFAIIGDLMYKMIMETGQLGKFIRDLVIKVCEFLSMLFEKAIKPIMCIVKEVVVGIVELIKTIIEGINSICPGGCGMGGMSKDLGDTKGRLEETLNCDIQNPFNCTSLFSDDGDLPSHLPMPTRCWVGYKPAVGEQDGLGCSASDTCMDDDGSLLACAACTGGIDMQRFGCDSLTKLCRCHTFPVGQTQCTSHQECQLPGTDCNFVDAYLQPSFGNIPCDRCSNQAVCLVSGSVGQCSCLLRTTPTQTCPAEYKTQRVSPDPTQLCLVSLGMSSSSSSSYSANWLDLSSAPCALLNGAQTWCLTVWLQNGGFSYMAVGLSLLSRRRLLSTNEMFLIGNNSAFAPNLTEWNQAHEPCRSLMLAENNLTILERHYASECERWRMIGERAIVIYNLSSTTPVQFTSYLGMAEASITPMAYVYLFKHADWAQPIFVMGRRYWHYIVPIINASRRIIQRIGTMPDTQEAITQVKELMPWYVSTNSKAADGNSSADGKAANNNTQNEVLRRRLLGWKDNLKAVHEYSVQIAEGNIANLAPDLASQWSKGPFLWPPTYNYWEKKHPCLAGEITWNLTFRTVESTVKYYTKTGPPRPAVARTFSEAMPNLTGIEEIPRAFEPELISTVKNAFKNLVGLDLSFIKRYVSSDGDTPSQLSQDITDLIRCDFEKVQHCTGQRRSLLWGAVIIAMLLAILSIVLRTLGVPMADIFLAMTFLPLTLWFVFNYSITCVPLVPTCMLSEILDLFETFIPPSITWPAQLQRWPNCLNGSTDGRIDSIKPATAQCFRECTAWPFEFQTWEDNALWIACEFGYCSADFIVQKYQPWVEIVPLPPFVFDLVHMDRYVAASKIKPNYMNWDDMKQAQRVCCAFTIFNVVPVVLLSVVILVAALAAVAIVIALVQSAINTIVALLTFIHTR